MEGGAPHAEEDTQLRIGQLLLFEASSRRSARTFQLAHPRGETVRAIKCVAAKEEPTWIHHLAVGTPVIARDRADKIVQGLFIPKLMALAEPDDHGHGVKGQRTKGGSSGVGVGGMIARRSSRRGFQRQRAGGENGGIEEQGASQRIKQ